MYEHQRKIIEWANSDKKMFVQLPRCFGKKTAVEMIERIRQRLIQQDKEKTNGLK